MAEPVAGPGLLVRWSRAGGRPPADDERLEVRDDGSFVGRRTVGGSRVGSFGGSLAEDDLESLRTAVAAAREAGDLWLDTPRDGATETYGLGPDEEPGASMGSNAAPEGPWGALVDRLRALADAVTAQPVAALELVDGDGGTDAQLVAAGDGSLEVDTASVTVRVVRLSGAGAVLGRWQGAAAASDPDWVAAAPGWSLDLPAGHDLAAGAGEWLQWWVFVRLRDADGERAARLFRAVPGR